MSINDALMQIHEDGLTGYYVVNDNLFSARSNLEQLKALQLTQIDGNASIHDFITISVLLFPC
jgi:hypothetical protein